MNSKNYNVLHIFWRLLGLFPFYYDEDDHIEFSYAILSIGIFHLAWSLPLCVWNLYVDISSDCKNSVRTLNKTTTVVTCCDTLSLALASSFSVVFASFNGKNIGKINLKLLKVKNKLGSSKRLIKADLVGFFLIFFYSILLIVDLIMSLEHLIIFLPTYIFHMIIFNVEMQVLTLALKVNFLFEIVNEKISGLLSQRKMFFTKALPNVDIIRGKKTLEPQELADYSEIHWALCATIDAFNRSFGVQVSAIFLSIFIHIIVSTFFVFVSLSHLSFTLPKLLLNVTWALTHAAQLYIIVWPCSSASIQGGKTSGVICKYLTKDLPTSLKRQCEIFLLKLVHHNTGFSALGLFQLDLPVITNIVGAVSTYLVILIQFQSLSTDCQLESDELI